MLTPMLMNACTPIHTPMPVRDQRRERPLEARRLPADRVRAEQQPHEQADDDEHAGEAQLLGDDRQQEIGVRFGQVEELLDRGAQPDAEPLAAAEGDQRMRQLVALAERIGPRIEERGEPLQPVRRGDEDRRETDRQQQQRGPRKSRQSSPPRNRMPNAIATITTNAPKSGSSSSRPLVATITANSGRKPLHDRLLQRLLGVQERRLAHRVARRVQHDGELHELGGLQVDDGERQPAPRAVDRLADAGNRTRGRAARRRR